MEEILVYQYNEQPDIAFFVKLVAMGEMPDKGTSTFLLRGISFIKQR
jgi:hypothetical protein